MFSRVSDLLIAYWDGTALSSTVRDRCRRLSEHVRQRLGITEMSDLHNNAVRHRVQIETALRLLHEENEQSRALIRQLSRTSPTGRNPAIRQHARHDRARPTVRTDVDVRENW